MTLFREPSEIDIHLMENDELAAAVAEHHVFRSPRRCDCPFVHASHWWWSGSVWGELRCDGGSDEDDLQGQHAAQDRLFEIGAYDPSTPSQAERCQSPESAL